MSPRLIPDSLCRFEEIAHDGVETFYLARPSASFFNLLPVGAHPAVDLIEQLRLQKPLLLTAPTAEAVDPVTERAAWLSIELVHDLRGELLIRCRPRDALVEIHEMA